ncbi:MAG: glycosyltransferase [Verrucomicrobiota bacterium]
MKSLFKCFPKVREKRLIFLSRIHPKKGLDLLLKVWSDLDQALVRNWEIAVFGPDERGYLAEIKALARQLNIEDSVSFFGSVSGIDKEAAFRSGNLFVLPSRSEGFPLAVLEAASYALPVIQTTECNFPELTEAGGAWEGEPEIDSIKQVLESALRADDKERQQRGEAGKALVSRNYQWSAIAVQVEAACKKYC